MFQRIHRNILIVIVLACLSAIVGLAESATPDEILAKTPTESWQVARSTSSSRDKILVVTVDKPSRKQSCRVQSFTDEKIVCSRAFGGSRTYLKQQVAALILPGDGALAAELFVGFNAGLGASIWATVVLAAACPICAAGTALAAFVFFDLAGLTAFTGGEPDTLVYLAPGQKRITLHGSVLR
jgi:hypothetical protein